MRHMTDPGDLILADEIGEHDDPEQCHIDGCEQTAYIVIGETGELEYCPTHAAQLALELLALPTVQEALARQGKVVIVTNETGAGHLRRMLKSVKLGGPQHERLRDYRRLTLDWLTERLNAIYDAKRQQVPTP